MSQAVLRNDRNDLPRLQGVAPIWLVVFEVCASKNGMAAREIERKYHVVPTTAWYMAHRIREAMKALAPHKLIGVIIADETYIGGNPKNWHATDPRHTGHGHGTEKIPVVAIIDADTGEARSRVTRNVNRTTLRRVLTENVELNESTLHTDKWAGYNPVGQDMAGHHTVDHSAGQYRPKGASARNALRVTSRN
jgi:transposase-like protein